MTEAEDRLVQFRKAVYSIRKQKGAIPAAHDRLSRLKEWYCLWPEEFTPAIINQIRGLKRRIPEGVGLADCPTCHGMGTQRWMKAYKHGCNRCGGWGQVERTAEVVRENNWIWGKNDPVPS